MVGTSSTEAAVTADRRASSGRLQLLRAVADPMRLAVLDSLAARGARCHRDLEVELGVSASRLSFHLKVLRDAGLVRANRRGRRVRYCIEPGAMGVLRAALPNVGEADALDPTCTACDREDAEVAR